MALPVNVRDVLHGGSVEWERLECKAGWNPLDVLHTVCAFANDFHNWGGGYVFVGVDTRDGRPMLPPVGLDPSALDALQLKIVELGNRLRPHYSPVVSPEVIDGRHILAIWVPGGQTRPYKAPVSLAKENRDHRYCIRKGSATVEAKDADEHELLGLAAKVPFDDRIRHQADLPDLSLGQMMAFLQEVGSALFDDAATLNFADLCRRMRIADGPDEYLKPLNVGLMFFGREPERFFPEMRIEVAVHPGGLAARGFTEKIFRGPLARQLQDALDYLRTQVVEPHVRKVAGRAEADRFFNYPYEALEEALVNAVYHRDYEIREPIEVQVLPDRIRISSFPGPDASISLAELEHGRPVTKRYRNRRVGDFLKELHLTEGRGTGIPTIRDAMRRNGSPMPRFETDEGRTYFTTVLPVHPALATLEDRSAEDQADFSEGVSTPRDDPRGYPPDPLGTPLGPPKHPPGPPQDVLNDVERELLEFCRAPRSRADVQDHLRVRDAKHVRERYLGPLVRAGLLELTDPSTPSSNKQRYRTTVGGAELLRLLRAPNAS